MVACEVCTFENEVGSLRCEMCHTTLAAPAAKEAAVTVTTTTTQAAATKACALCAWPPRCVMHRCDTPIGTFENGHAASTCEVCRAWWCDRCTMCNAATAADCGGCGGGFGATMGGAFSSDTGGGADEGGLLTPAGLVHAYDARKVERRLRRAAKEAHGRDAIRFLVSDPKRFLDEACGIVALEKKEEEEEEAAPQGRCVDSGGLEARNDDSNAASSGDGPAPSGDYEDDDDDDDRRASALFATSTEVLGDGVRCVLCDLGFSTAGLARAHLVVRHIWKRPPVPRRRGPKRRRAALDEEDD